MSLLGQLDKPQCSWSVGYIAKLSHLLLQVLDMKWSDFKKAGYPTTAGASENDNPNGA